MLVQLYSPVQGIFALALRDLAALDVVSFFFPCPMNANHPQSLRNSVTLSDSNRTDGTESFAENSVTQSLCSSVALSLSPSVTLYDSIKTLEDVLRLFVPTNKENWSLFLFARGLRTLEAKRREDLTPDEVTNAFNQWYSRSVKFLDSEKTKFEYETKFSNEYEHAKTAFGNEAIKRAWQLANEEPPPDDAYEFENPKFRLLVALCWQLQVIAGDKPFYLSCRTVQELLGLGSHSTAAEWLSHLRVKNIIREIEKGNNKTEKPKASRYRYGYWKP